MHHCRKLNFDKTEPLSRKLEIQVNKTMISAGQFEVVAKMISALASDAQTQGSIEPGMVAVNSVELQALLVEVNRLASLEQRLMLGIHEHSHGESLYPFLVPRGADFGPAEFEPHIVEDYEPERDEYLRVVDLDMVQLIGPADVAAVKAVDRPRGG